MKARHHVIVGGTGRAATTFLMQIFTNMGLDTGFPRLAKPMEWSDWNRPDTPYIIKRPQFCDELGAFLAAGCIVDHAIIPLRDIRAAADSRRRRAEEGGGPNANGGLFGTLDPSKQEEVLREKLGQLMKTINDHGIEHTIVQFDRINDANYVFGILRHAFSSRYFVEFTEVAFKAAYAEVTEYRNQYPDDSCVISEWVGITKRFKGRDLQAEFQNPFSYDSPVLPRYRFPLPPLRRLLVRG